MSSDRLYERSGGEVNPYRADALYMDLRRLICNGVASARPGSPCWPRHRIALRSHHCPAGLHGLKWRTDL